MITSDSLVLIFYEGNFFVVGYDYLRIDTHTSVFKTVSAVYVDQRLLIVSDVLSNCKGINWLYEVFLSIYDTGIRWYFCNFGGGLKLVYYIVVY